MQCFTCSKRQDPGFTLLGTLMALAVGGILLGGLIHLCLTQTRHADAQDTMRDMVQNASIVLEVMTRDIRMAGYNPTGASFDGITYAPSQLRIRADLNGDGDTDDPGEDILYTYDAAQQQILRIDHAGQELLADNIQAFTLAYRDKDGQPTTSSTDIRQIRLTVTTRAEGVDTPHAPQHSPRTYTLTTLVNRRNVAASAEHSRS